jgi:hypothetical protein
MCKSIDLKGLPTLQEAWNEVKSMIGRENKIWSHSAIQHAYKQTGSWDLKHLSEKEAYKLFERNYEITLRMISEGKELEPILPAITKEYYKKESNQVNNGTTMEHIEKLKKMLKN